MRIRSIDVFRGLAVALMVFFTIFALLSPSPGFLQHNKPGSLHFGDFVLPMFLFASGMSLVFFAKKRERMGRPAYAIDCLDRLTRLFLVSLFLAPLTAGFLGMDVIMLNLLLSIPALLLIPFPETASAAASLSLFALYFILSGMDMLPDFSTQHLGGYPAAIFYLPVMLGGVIAGKRILEQKNLDILLAASAIISIALLILVSPWKMVASPSFMALSVVFSLLFFRLTELWLSGGLAEPAAAFLEYLGKNSIRYWVLMFVLIIIPLDVYALRLHLDFPLGIEWGLAVLLALVSLAILYSASKGMDFAESAITKLIKN